MSNHFTGLNLGPPEGDTRLDLTDLYVFQVPTDTSRTVVILNCNSFAKEAAFHPDAVYRINIDNNGDLETDLALILAFSEPRDGRQRATVYLATGPEARSAEPAGEPIFKDIEVSFGPQPQIHTSGPYTCFVGLRSDAFFIDFAGILNMFDYKGGKNFTGYEGTPDPSRWTRKDLFANYNVFSMAFELPTRLLGANPGGALLGAGQHSPRRQARSRGSLRPPDLRELLLHRRDQTRIQPGRACSRPGALPRPNDPHVRTRRGLFQRRSQSPDRCRGGSARHAELQPLQARRLPERPPAHRPRRRAPPRHALERQDPARRTQAAY